MKRHERDPAPGRHVVEAVIAFLTGGDPRGYTPADIVAALDLPIAATALQGVLERLVAHDTLTRWGIGRSALYTRRASFIGPSAVRRWRANAATLLVINGGQPVLDGVVPGWNPPQDRADVDRARREGDR